MPPKDKDLSDKRICVGLPKMDRETLIRVAEALGKSAADILRDGYYAWQREMLEDPSVGPLIQRTKREVAQESMGGSAAMAEKRREAERIASLPRIDPENFAAFRCPECGDDGRELAGDGKVVRTSQIMGNAEWVTLDGKEWGYYKHKFRGPNRREACGFECLVGSQ